MKSFVCTNRVSSKIVTEDDGIKVFILQALFCLQWIMK